MLNTDIPTLQIDSKNVIYISKLETDRPEYWMSKLAFRPYQSNESKVEITINRGHSFQFDKLEYRLAIPHDIPEHIACYLLRTVSDYLQVSIGGLPLHAAAVTINNCQIIILANSGSGKSYISQLLNSFNPDSFVIGDDHIIIHDTYIQGNQYMRIRAQDTSKPMYVANRGWGHRQRTLIVCYEQDPSRCICTSLHNHSELIAKMKNLSAFKYLMNGIVLNGKNDPINNIWKEDMLKTYELSALAVADSAEAFSIIGSHHYAVEQIHKYVYHQ